MLVARRLPEQQTTLARHGLLAPAAAARARSSGPAARAQAWRLQQWVQDRVDEQLKGLALLARPVIGFHVRHGDKVAEDQALVRAHIWPSQTSNKQISLWYTLLLPK